MGHGPASGRTETRKESARSGLRRTVRFLSSYNYLQKYRPYSLRIATFSTGTFWSSARFREAAAGTPRNKESLFFILLRTAFSRTVPSQHSPCLHQINYKDKRRHHRPSKRRIPRRARIAEGRNHPDRPHKSHQQLQHAGYHRGQFLPDGLHGSPQDKQDTHHWQERSHYPQVICAPIGLGHTAVTQVLQAEVLLTSPADRRGVASTTFMLLGNIGGMGTALWGAVSSGAGYAAAYTLAGAATLLGCLFHGVYWRKRQDDGAERKFTIKEAER